jgi:hypothetical protein
VRRPRTRLLIAAGFGLFVFVGISLLLARSLGGASTERGAVIDLLRAQAAGDARSVLARLPECRAEPACARSTAATVARVRAPGRVVLLTYTPSSTLALSEMVGTGRAAWRAGAERPVVQCVRVRRSGPLSRRQVELLSISAPIPNDASCPS